MVRSEAATHAGRDGGVAVHQWFMFGGLQRPTTPRVVDLTGRGRRIASVPFSSCRGSCRELPCGKRQRKRSGVRAGTRTAAGIGDSYILG
jgi:hypothetical protein